MDTNSGFSSLANQITTYFLKDEAPKAPVFLFAVGNRNQVAIGQAASEDERTNAATRQRLIDLNQSLFLSEIEDVDLIVPFDTVQIGEH